MDRLASQARGVVRASRPQPADTSCRRQDRLPDPGIREPKGEHGPNGPFIDVHMRLVCRQVPNDGPDWVVRSDRVSMSPPGHAGLPTPSIPRRARKVSFDTSARKRRVVRRAEGQEAMLRVYEAKHPLHMWTMAAVVEGQGERGLDRPHAAAAG